ncbi:helix-turn-helix transcriptional regulator [Cryobacterium sp. BB736]|uniref:helix-turn-helix domain-containing protein n=1 Tax=Cryobacterium sp. BB736 TaxID=2746963 RepID=UPI001875AF45|nr:helix-turn-helix transcriptional regulator [Cryobacterium sp. BB736]
MDKKRPSDFDAAVASVLDQAITDYGITYVRLSERSGIPYTTLYKYVKGASPMPLAAFTKLANVVGVNPGEIIHAAQTVVNPTEQKPRI